MSGNIIKSLIPEIKKSGIRESMPLKVIEEEEG